LKSAATSGPYYVLNFFVAHDVASMGEKKIKTTGKTVAVKQYAMGKAEKNGRYTQQNLTKCNVTPPK
jgi:hypothetical protein